MADNQLIKMISLRHLCLKNNVRTKIGNPAEYGKFCKTYLEELKKFRRGWDFGTQITQKLFRRG